MRASSTGRGRVARHVAAATAAGVVMAALVGGSALAAPASITWSAYLRSGPGQTYEAITELEHDTRVEVAGCDANWCRVSNADAQGYVDRQALDLRRTLAPVPPANADCVVASQYGPRKPIPTRFCSAHPSGG